VTLFEITNVGRAGWQRRAVAELTRILDTHRDLPVVAWTVCSAGSALVGQVNAFPYAVEVRQVFEIWRVALFLEGPSQTTGGGTVHLRASADRNLVRVRLTATVFGDAEDARW
jgi:hypothetical protein